MRAWRSFCPQAAAGTPTQQGFRQREARGAPDGVEVLEPAGEFGQVGKGPCIRARAGLPLPSARAACRCPSRVSGRRALRARGRARWARPGPSVPPKVTSSFLTERGCMASRRGRSRVATGFTTTKSSPRSTLQAPWRVSQGRTLRPSTSFGGPAGHRAPSRKGWKRRSACSWASPSSSITATFRGRRAWICSGAQSHWSKSATSARALSSWGRAAWGILAEIHRLTGHALGRGRGAGRNPLAGRVHRR